MKSITVTVYNSGSEEINVSKNSGTPVPVQPGASQDVTLSNLLDTIAITGDATVTSGQSTKYLTKSTSITYTYTTEPSNETETETVTVQDDDPGEES